MRSIGLRFEFKKLLLSQMEFKQSSISSLDKLDSCEYFFAKYFLAVSFCLISRCIVSLDLFSGKISAVAVPVSKNQKATQEQCSCKVVIKRKV